MFRHLNQHPGAGRGHAHDQHPFARFGGGHGREDLREHFGRAFKERMHGGGRERMFDTGEFQLVLLSLIAQKPSYGYELIKTLEEKLAGGYAPSPGVIYPTLTLLEEGGMTSSATEGGRKVYTITPSGTDHLAVNKQRLEAIQARLNEAGEGFEGGRSPEIHRAMRNLHRAIMNRGLRARMSRDPLTAEVRRKIIEALDAAARTIDEL